MSNAVAATSTSSRPQSLKQVKPQAMKDKLHNDDGINRIVFDENENLPPTEVTIVKNIFYVRHRGALIQIPADQVPCLTYDVEENRVNIICDKAPDDMKEQGIPVRDERDAEILTHMLIRAVQEYHRRLAQKRRAKVKEAQQENMKTSYQPKSSRSEESKRDGQSKLLWLIGGVVVLAIVVILLVAIMSSGSGEAAPSVNSMSQHSIPGAAASASAQPWKP